MKSGVKECVLPEDTSPEKCIPVIPFNTSGCEDNSHTDKETAIKMFGLHINNAGDKMSGDDADTDPVNEFVIGDVDYVPTWTWWWQRVLYTIFAICRSCSH